MTSDALKVLTLNTSGLTWPRAALKAIIIDGIRELEPHIIGLN